MNTTMKAAGEVEVIHTFRSDIYDLSSYFLACGLEASVFYISLSYSKLEYRQQLRGRDLCTCVIQGRGSGVPENLRLIHEI